MRACSSVGNSSVAQPRGQPLEPLPARLLARLPVAEVLRAAPHRSPVSSCTGLVDGASAGAAAVVVAASDMLHTVRYGLDVWQDVDVTTSAPAGHRLSLDDWTSRALDLLISEGVGALKVARLCRELGVTKGSFYWHFTDLEALKKAVADRWCEQTRATLDQTSAMATCPRWSGSGSWPPACSRTARGAWSAPCASGRAPTRRSRRPSRDSERHVFALVEDALRELGHSDRDARLRAGLLVYAGIGFAHGQQSLPRADHGRPRRPRRLPLQRHRGPRRVVGGNHLSLGGVRAA